MAKRLLKIIICFLLILMYSASIFAVEIDASDIDTQKTLIKIGYIDAANHIIEASDNSLNGIGYEYFIELENYSNYLFEHISVTPEAGFEMLHSGEIDLLGPMPVSDQYVQENYLYTSEPVSNAEIVMTAPLNSGMAQDDFALFEQKIISVENYVFFNAYNNILLSYAENNGIHLNVISTKNPGNMAWDQISTGYDIHVTELSQTNSTLEVVGTLGFEPLHYLALDTNDVLIDEIDVATREILLNDYTYLNKLNLKYTDEELLAKPAYTVLQKELLNEKQTIDVFYSSDNKPFQWEDENSTPQGISIEIMNLIAEDLGVEVNYYNEADTKSGSDADINLTLVGSGDFSKDFVATQAYLTLPISLIGEPQAHDEQYLNVASLQYHNVDLSNTLNITGSYIIAYYNTVDEMINALQAGRVDFVVSPLVTNDYIMSFDLGDDFFVTQLDYELPMRIMLNKELEEEFQDILNIAIQRLDTTKIDSIIAESRLHYIPEETMLEFIQDNFFVIIIVIMAIACAFTFVVWRGKVRREKDLLNIINFDSLTGLMSKYSFFEQARKTLETATPGQYALYVVDIDNFKIVNETFGYNKGSQVIKHVANSLKQYLNPSALVAREANDKFIFMTPITSEAVTIENAQKQELLFRLSLREILADDYTIHVSVGKYVVHDTKLDLDYMIDCANYARISAKAGYGSTVAEFTNEMRSKQKLQNEVVSGMETALFGEEFQVYYQPKIDLKTMKIVGAEALVRWIKNGKPIFYPDQFIPIFENNRFIIRLDYFVTHKVCDLIKINYDLLSNYKISVNLSGITLLQENLTESLLDTVKNSGIKPSNLELEITESAFVENFELVVSAINNLKKCGFSISMDDFGSGLSSYNRFKDIPLDILKLDKGFCSFSCGEKKGTMIVESIISLAKQLNLQVVAEGVETQEQAQMLRELGCDVAQGYLYAKPMPKDEFINMLKNS